MKLRNWEKCTHDTTRMANPSKPLENRIGKDGKERRKKMVTLKFIENIMHFLCGEHLHFGTFSSMSLMNITIVHSSAIIIRAEQFSIHAFQRSTDWNMKLNMNNPFPQDMQYAMYSIRHVGTKSSSLSKFWYFLDNSKFSKIFLGFHFAFMNILWIITIYHKTGPQHFRCLIGITVI